VERVFGLITTASPEEAAFGEEELRVLAALAEQVLKDREDKVEWH